MADSAVVNLGAATLASGSYLYVVTDPTGTPADERATIGALITFAEANLSAPVVSTSITFDGVTITGVSGADVTLVTGTAGTNGQIASWNGDGDVVGVDTATAGTISAKTTAVGADQVLIFDSADSNALKKMTRTNWLSDANSTYSENAQTGTTYTLVLADHGRAVSVANASAQALTIPANATVPIPVGAMIPVISKGAGVLTITAASGVALNGVTAGSGVVGTPASGLYPGVTLYKVGTDAWYVVGNIAAVA